jgi:hypothetical protein
VNEEYEQPKKKIKTAQDNYTYQIEIKFGSSGMKRSKAVEDLVQYGQQILYKDISMTGQCSVYDMEHAE